MNLNDACYHIFPDASMAGKTLRQKQMQWTLVFPVATRGFKGQNEKKVTIKQQTTLFGKIQSFARNIWFPLRATGPLTRLSHFSASLEL